MSVTGVDTKVLFCEGLPDSLDSRLLNRMLTGLTSILVVPSGGKYSLRGFIDGYVSSYRTTTQYIAFRDRDYDMLSSPRVGLLRLPGAKPIFLTHRASIESYLLDASLLDAYWNLHSAAPNWKHGTSPGMQAIQDWMDEAAKQITDYQAARWALSSLKPSSRWPAIATTWTGGSGHIPLLLTPEACLTEAKALVAAFSEDAQKVSEAVLTEKFVEYSARFQTPTFWSQRDYLVWFHGKDLKHSMQKQREHSISMNHFCSWAVDHMVWTAHADLQELLAKI